MKNSTPLSFRATLIICFLALALGSARAQVATPTWLSATIDTTLTARDAAGNVYTTGEFRGAVTFGATTLTSVGGADVYVTKRSPGGAYLWAVRAGCPSDDESQQIFVDGNGTVTLSGMYEADTADFGPFQLPYGGFFVARLSAAGNWMWVRAVVNTLSTFRIAKIDQSGSVYLIGDAIGGTMLLGSPWFFSSPQGLGSVALVAKLAPNGTWEWANGTDGPYQNSIAGLDLDSRGNVYVIGNYYSPSLGISNPTAFGDPSFTNMIFLPPLPMASIGASGNVFVAKISVRGLVQWAVAADTSTSFARGSSLALDGLGNIVIAGEFQNATFGNTMFDRAGLFVAKLTTGGAWKWAVRGRGLASIGLSKAAADGSTYVAGHFNDTTITLGNTTLTNNSPLSNDIFVAKLSAGGSWQWATSAGGPGNQFGGPPFNAWGRNFHNERDALTVDVQGIVTLSSVFESPTATFGGINLTNPYTNTLARYTARLLPPDGAQLGGTAYLDTNGNGTRDAGEQLVEQPAVIEVQPGPFYMTTAAGAYGTTVLPGNYTLRLPNPPPYFTVTPTTHSAAFASSGQTDTTNHFGLRATANVNDLRVTLTPVRAFRAGQRTRYEITCYNPGTNSQSATLALMLAPQFIYTSSAPAATLAGRTLTWNLGALAPLQSRRFIVDGSLPTTAQLDDSIVAVATLMSALPDLTPADNRDTATVLVTGPYDPNDKLVSTESMTPAQVQAGRWLTYTIRFQNTGNDTAFYVLIRDTLSAHVQRGTLEVLAASHPLTWELKGVGIASFRFPNILLPDSGRNEPASHGFVKYRVRVLPTLAVGDSVTNAADIYFDFNPPIRTNTAVTRVERPVGVAEDGPRLLASLYPNPANATARLHLEAAAPGRLQVRVFNTLGQLVWQEQTLVRGGPVRRSLPIGQWPAGVYQVQVQCGEQLITRQLVVQP